LFAAERKPHLLRDGVVWVDEILPEEHVVGRKVSFGTSVSRWMRIKFGRKQ
jgi:hypothetical protein